MFMCAFEEEINQYFSDKLNETMEIVFVLQYNLYRKKYEKYNKINI